MSAATSNSSDRELEALRRAQRAHEPSMEEILASIRTIIAEEREPAKVEPAKPAPMRPTTAVPGPQIVYSKEASKDVPAERHTAQEPQLPEISQTPESNAPKVVWRQPEPAASDPAEDGRSSADDDPLLSSATDQAVTSAFAVLSAELAARSAELADGMIREMLRPMLKAWLDENLPGIVERLVRAEIERLARGAR